MFPGPPAEAVIPRKCGEGGWGSLIGCGVFCWFCFVCGFVGFFLFVWVFVSFGFVWGFLLSVGGFFFVWLGFFWFSFLCLF